MRLNKIQPPKLEWGFESHPANHVDYKHDSEALCETAGVFQQIGMEENRTINEATYKELTSMIDGNFLNQKVRADALTGIELSGIQDNVMTFFINSSEHDSNRIVYRVNVQFDDWEDIAQDASFNNNEKARMLLWVGNIKVGCTCPSFIYHGYAYLLTVLDASYYPESRKPVKTNPNERGICCKHCNRVLRVLPFYMGDIASAMKTQYGRP